MPHDNLPVLIVAVVAVGVLAQWFAWRFRLPAIILLSVAGLLLGPVFGAVEPSADFGEWLRPIISLCVAIILFEGGLSLDLAELKLAARGVGRLVYVGAPLAWITCSLASHYIGGLEWEVSLVLGAILVVTGPTVIMPLLRQSGLNRRTASYLKWEGIINDPIGALLAVLVFQFFYFTSAGESWFEVGAGFFGALVAALILGGLGGWAIGRALLAGWVPEYLKSPVLLCVVLVAYVGANAMQPEAGLLTVTVMGVVVGNMHLPGINDMKRFKEYITVMLVSVVFVLLTADLNPEILARLGWREALLVAAILFVTRPLTVWLATLGAGMDWRDRLLLGWIAPRGIVAAATAGIMGPGLMELGYEDAFELLPLVFAVIFATVVLHGLTIGWISRRLGLASPHRDSVLIVGAWPWTVELARKLREHDIKVLLADSSWHNLRPARLAGVPVFFGEILSDFAEESLEIPHVAAVLAATSNEAYNALICQTLAPELGHGNVYQLAMAKSEEDNAQRVARPLRGQLAFDRELRYDDLWRLQVKGFRFYKTRLSETYTYSDLLGDLPSDAVRVLWRTADGKVRFVSHEAEREPQAGDTLFYYGPARVRERAAEPEGEGRKKAPAPAATPGELPSSIRT
jgi:NhaP-type Na+/H+ or K+/H+ antiporter